ERRIRRGGDDVRLHGVFDRHRVESGPLRARAVPQGSDQPAIEEVSLADDTDELSSFVEDREMADTAESHHVVGDRQLVVAIERDDIAGHHVTHEAKMSHGLSSSSHSSWSIDPETRVGADVWDRGSAAPGSAPTGGFLRFRSRRRSGNPKSGSGTEASGSG